MGDRLHHQRHPEIRRRDDGSANKLFRHHSDDGVWLTIKVDALADDARIRIEALAPQRIADDYSGICSRRAIFFREKTASEGRVSLQHIKIIAADKLAVDALGLAIDYEAHRTLGISSQACEGAGLISISEIVRI